MLQFYKNKVFIMFQQLSFAIIQKKLISFQFYILIFLILILPYWGFFEIFQHLSILLFLSVIVSGIFNIKEILSNKYIITLSLFFLFCSLSLLWSPVQETTWEYWHNLHNYKYYFILLFSIFSMQLSLKTIKNLFFIMALSPIGISIIYYLNAFGVTHIYSALFFHGNSNLISHYLINNFFILYSATYFYILCFEFFIKKQYKSMIFSLITSIFFAVSLVIDPLSVARLMLVAFFLVLLVVPLFYLHKRYALILIALLLATSTLFISQNTKMQKGIKTITKAIEDEKYTGSWGHRLGFAIVGIKIFSEHPIIGRGINDVRARTIKFSKDNPQYFKGDKNRHFHNEHINFLVEVGIIGYTLFCIFIYLFLKLPIQNSFLNKLKYIFIIYFLLLMCGEHYISIQQTGSFFFIFIALTLLYHKEERLLRTNL